MKVLGWFRVIREEQIEHLLRNLSGGLCVGANGVENLASENGNFARRFNSQLDLVAGDSENLYPYVISDDERRSRFSGDNQHTGLRANSIAEESS